MQVTEVMYSPEGTDSGHEWIEVENTSGQSIDFSTWNFRENETDHRLTAVSESSLSSGEFAVIVQDPAKFQADFPDFSGLLFDASFGLRNGGEPVSLVNASGTVVDSLHYDPDTGADGDGNSLQLSSGSWLAAQPTPGKVNASESHNPSVDEEEDTDDADESSSIYVLEPRTENEEESSSGEVAGAADTNADTITIDAGNDINAIAGVPVRLSGTVEASHENLLEDRSVRWSLGNGDTKEGADVFYTYNHPGEYKAMLSVSDAATSFSDGLAVSVVAADVAVSDTRSGEDGYVAVTNNLSRDLDLSGWHLVDGGDMFTFPAHTSVLAGEDITVENNVSGLSGSSAAELWYPDGTPVNTSQEASEPSTGTSTVSMSVSGDDNEIGQTSESPGSSEGETEPETQNDTQSSESGTQTDPDGNSLEDTFSSSSQAAAAATGDDGMFFQWAAVLTMILLAGLGGIVLMRRFAVAEDNPKLLAGNIDINEM